MTSTRLHTNDRFLKLADRMEGSMDSFVSGQINYGRFKPLSSST